MTKVNLLPGWLKRQRVIDWRAIALVVLLVSAATLAIFRHYLVIQEVELVRAELQRVSEEQVLLRPSLDRRVQLQAELQAIRDKMTFLERIRARRWAPVLAEVARLTPVNVQVLLMEFSNPDDLVLTGKAGSLESIAQLMVGIDRSGLLQRSAVKYARDDDGRYDFEIRCRVR
ncbi:MAG: PilN domain-containing protein [bacterium]|nr:PilN domain-containing protein [bacterium]